MLAREVPLQDAACSSCPIYLSGNSWCWKSTTEAKQKASVAAAAPGHQMPAAMRYRPPARLGVQRTVTFSHAKQLSHLLHCVLITTQCS